MKKSKLMCPECLPSKPILEHNSYKGMLIHSRTDCPPSTVYMISDNDWELMVKKVLINKR